MFHEDHILTNSFTHFEFKIHISFRPPDPQHTLKYLPLKLANLDSFVIPLFLETSFWNLIYNYCQTRYEILIHSKQLVVKIANDCQARKRDGVCTATPPRPTSSIQPWWLLGIRSKCGSTIETSNETNYKSNSWFRFYSSHSFYCQ